MKVKELNMNDYEGMGEDAEARLLKDLAALPPNSFIDGDLVLVSCDVHTLPEGLEVNGYLDLERTPITELPNGLKCGDLDISYTHIRSFPENIHVVGSLRATDTHLQTISSGTIVEGNAEFLRSPLTHIPAGAKFGGDVYAYDCKNFVGVDPDATINGKLFVDEDDGNLNIIALLTVNCEDVHFHEGALTTMFQYYHKKVKSGDMRLAQAKVALTEDMYDSGFGKYIKRK